MAVREIKTKLTIDSEKQFNREIQEAGRNMRVMASEMKAAAADFNLTGNEMDYLTRKSDALNSQIKQQETIIEALKDAVASSAKAWGDASAKTDGYRIKLANAEASMAKLKKELQETDAEMAEMGRDSTRVGRQLENGIGEAADDVGRKFDQMVEKLDVDLSEIGSATKFSAIIEGGGMIANMASQVIEGIDQVVEGTEDYRRRMSFLEQNAITAGLDPDQLKAVAMKVASITGDMDGAIEGVSNLAAAGLDMNEIATAADRLVAAAIMWPDTLKFESMADGLQESIATKSAVGAYAELLERLGLDIEKVNESMEATPDANAAQTAAMAWMTEHGLEESLQNYVDMNAEMIAAEDAQLRYNDALANFAKALVPVHTEWNNFKTDFLTGTTELINGGFDTWLGGLEEKLRSGLGLNEWMENLLGEDLYNKLFVEGHEDTPVPEAGQGTTYTGAVNPEDLIPKTVTPGMYAGAVDLGSTMGDTTATAFSDTVETSIEEEFTDNTDLETAGKNADVSVANGITENGQVVVDAAANVADATIAEFNRVASSYAAMGQMVGAPPVYGAASGAASSYAAASGGRWIDNVTLTLDGRELGRTGSNYIGDTLGLQASRQEVYGP